ncbi:DUF7577 domain-containing protein [Halorientalis salina]|uniref:DUF7577 domain-containing protein n=1 Tax=Halorientalis salina TaxID=2932266 RepID=UPI0010AB8DFB|nr:hypothetical protein [Halorientalis salina]
MDSIVWAVVLAVATNVYFLSRGWQDADSNDAGTGAYWTARTASRDGTHMAVVDADTVTCRRCGGTNDSEFRYCHRCTTPLPERQFATACD